MPFKSKKQQRKCYAMKSKGRAGSWDCSEWSSATNFKKLPVRVKKASWDTANYLKYAAAKVPELSGRYEKIARSLLSGNTLTDSIRLAFPDLNPMRTVKLAQLFITRTAGAQRLAKSAHCSGPTGSRIVKIRRKKLPKITIVKKANYYNAEDYSNAMEKQAILSLLAKIPMALRGGMTALRGAKGAWQGARALKGTKDALGFGGRLKNLYNVGRGGGQLKNITRAGTINKNLALSRKGIPTGMDAWKGLSRGAKWGYGGAAGALGVGGMGMMGGMSDQPQNQLAPQGWGGQGAGAVNPAFQQYMQQMQQYNQMQGGYPGGGGYQRGYDQGFGGGNPKRKFRKRIKRKNKKIRGLEAQLAARGQQPQQIVAAPAPAPAPAIAAVAPPAPAIKPASSNLYGNTDVVRAGREGRGERSSARQAAKLEAAKMAADYIMSHTSYGDDVDLSDVRRAKGVDSQLPPGGRNFGKRRVLNY